MGLKTGKSLISLRNKKSFNINIGITKAKDRNLLMKMSLAVATRGNKLVKNKRNSHKYLNTKKLSENFEKMGFCTVIPSKSKK